MNYLEMYYPSCFFRYYGIETKDESDTSILDNALEKVIAYLKFDVSPTNKQCLIVFRGDNMYNEFISNLINNDIAYKEDKYTYRCKTQINNLLEEYTYDTNITF